MGRSKEALVPIQPRDDGNSDTGVSGGKWEQLSDSRLVLKVEPA